MKDIKDVPHLTVEQVAALRLAAVQLEEDDEWLLSKLNAAKLLAQTVEE